MLPEHLDLGAILLGILTSRTVQTVQIRLVDDVRIDEQNPPHPGSSQEFRDRASRTTATDNADTELLQKLHRFNTDGERLTLKKPGANLLPSTKNALD